MVKKSMKGVILTGEKDGALPQQKTMVEMFEEMNFSYQFIINNGLGHWFPENLPDQIDEGINYITLTVGSEA